MALVLLLRSLLLLLIVLETSSEATNKVSRYIPVKVSLPNNREDLKLMVPAKPNANSQISSPKKLLKLVEDAWKVVVEENPTGLQDAKLEAKQLQSPPLSAKEAWHHFKASQEGVVDSARFLVTFGIVASIQAGGSELHTAAALGQIDRMKEILDDPESLLEIDEKKSLDGTTPLHCAISTGQAEVVAFLLERGANIEAVGNNGVSPLQLAATLGDNRIVRLLVEANADLDAAHKFGGTTSLHFAAEMGNVDVIETLCKAGANGNVKKTTGGTPLHIAADTNQTEAAVALVKHCPDLDIHALLVGDTTALYLAAQRGLTSMCQTLIEDIGANPNFEMPEGQNMGHQIALDDKDEESIKKRRQSQFYEQKNTESGNGATALHAACENGHLETAQVLLDLGALQSASMQGATPLIISMQYRHPKSPCCC